MAQGAPSITIIGNLTADPELRFTPSGQAVANFTVASTARFFDKQTSEWQDGDTTFIRCSVWREMAENVAESLTKGTRVVVTGTLKVRQYETDKGKGTSVECDVEEVGPSLKWASASLTRNSQRGGGAPQASRGRADDDPWARHSSDAGAGSGYPDGPPPF
jgi:single-strand DNA-binding protein